MGLLNFAKRYRDLGLHPIPIEARGKRPVIESWKKYQTVAPNDIELRSWFGRDENVNMAVVLGRGIIAVDFDGDGSTNLLKDKGIGLPIEAPLSRTGNGHHVLLRTNEPIGDCVGLLNTNGGKPQIDIRGIGYIVVPPSIHANGNKYEWIIPPSGKIPNTPEALLELIKNKNGPSKKLNSPGWVSEALAGVGEGQRDSMCAKLAGYFLGKNIDSATVKLILNSTFAAHCNPQFPIQGVIKTVDSIAQKNGVTGEIDREIVPRAIKDVAMDFADSLEGNPIKVAPTGFSELDYLLCGGFYPGDLVYMGARPGVGKTAMALQIASSVAKAGSGVVFISREMTSMALIRRMVSQSGKIDASILRRSDRAKSSMDRIKNTLDDLISLPIWMTDEVVSIEEAANMISGFNQTTPVGLIIVDHLQLMRSSGSMKEKRMQVEAVSQGLKTIAMQFKVPILCMSTLSRPADKKNTRPTLDSLRESGELEHDADIVLLIHREFGKNEAECIVAKNRDGHVGSAKLLFESQYLSFATFEEETIQKQTSLPYGADEE